MKIKLKQWWRWSKLSSSKYWCLSCDFWKQTWQSRRKEPGFSHQICCLLSGSPVVWFFSSVSVGCREFTLLQLALYVKMVATMETEVCLHEEKAYSTLRSWNFRLWVFLIAYWLSYASWLRSHCTKLKYLHITSTVIKNTLNYQGLDFCHQCSAV